MGKRSKPIILKRHSMILTMDPEAPILLHENGTISCGDLVYKDRTRQKDYKQQYQFIADKRKKQRRSKDIGKLYNPGILEMISAARSRGKKSIPVKQLIDVFGVDD